MTLTPEQRSLRASVAALTRLAREDAREVTKPARLAFMDKFLTEVDPAKELSEQERYRRAEAANCLPTCNAWH